MKKIASLVLIFLVGLSLLFACNYVDNNKLYLEKQIMTDKSGTVTYIRTSHSSNIILTVTKDEYGNVTKQEDNIG